MKCPKCGYNSFEYHDICKKCSADLVAYKLTYNITPIVLPSETKEERVAEFRSISSANELAVESTETHDDIFSFDLPDESVPPSASRIEDPFNFDYDLPGMNPPQAKAKNAGFSDLLKPASEADNDLFPPPDSFAPPAKANAPTLDHGEFDLENFSWDDTPAPAATSGAQVTADDFDSLFGDTDSSTKK